MNDTEHEIKKVLQNNFDFVFKCDSKNLRNKKSVYLQSSVKAKLSSIAGYNEVKSMKHFFRSGVPDFLAFNSNFGDIENPKNNISNIEISDIKFVEVKKREDSVRPSQLTWFSDFNELPAEIWVVSGKEKHRLSTYRPEYFTSTFIPEEFMNLMSWDKGDNLEFEIKNENTIEITRKEEEA